MRTTRRLLLGGDLPLVVLQVAHPEPGPAQQHLRRHALVGAGGDQQRDPRDPAREVPGARDRRIEHGRNYGASGRSALAGAPCGP
ncbi:hypothetical protein G5V59_04205 [Nocardioides sp. W3-2-3]|uniref:hypothetical protein n=1 Tax=Nocardioides convexus TaxID=2712224 RepID=UPI002418445C|nr:hypothetical protein [Nocardioides convexus]NGZ99796.1 hypothetical protein [Nocardioides convexus]